MSTVFTDIFQVITENSGGRKGGGGGGETNMTVVLGLVQNELSSPRTGSKLIQ